MSNKGQREGLGRAAICFLRGEQNPAVSWLWGGNIGKDETKMEFLEMGVPEPGYLLAQCIALSERF